MGLETLPILAKSTQKSLSLLISIACLTFVLYQGYKCWTKYATVPRSTDVSIEKARQYPDVTICPRQLWSSPKLHQCNLTIYSYFGQHQWSSDNPNCTDPQQVYEEMVGKVSDLILYLNLTGYDQDILALDMDDPNNFRVHDDTKGRCYTLNWAEGFDVASIQLGSYYETSVSIHAPDRKFGTEGTSVNLYDRTTNRITVWYETFEVLDFDGETCVSDMYYKRDDCLYEAIQKESEDQIGCYTPFNVDKSNICTEVEDARQAMDVFDEIAFRNYTKAKEFCPKACQQYIIGFSNKEWFFNAEFDQVIKATFEFPRFIRTSKTHHSYTALELIAEVGGYVGLFLGVSINQISNIFEILIGKLVSKNKYAA